MVFRYLDLRGNAVRAKFYRNSAYSAAAPATVSGERLSSKPLESLGFREGRENVVTREPGDLPSRVIQPFAGAAKGKVLRHFG